MLKVIALSVLSCMMVVSVFLSRLMAAEPSTPAGVSTQSDGFKPVVEAPLPDGFPTYTPVGKIEVKQYPAYRKAETSGRVAFWTLFEHITSSGISMTAPVEMTYEKDGAPVGKERAMAFFMGRRTLAHRAGMETSKWSTFRLRR